MKKVLIWDNRKLANIGGPSGYLFNIHEYLKKHPNHQIVFLSDLVGNGDQSLSTANTPKRTKGFMYNLKQIINITWRWYHQITPGLPKNLDLNQFDFIHVHNLHQVLCFRNQYPKYKGKLIVTSHSPEPKIDEFLSNNKGLSFLRFIGIRRDAHCFESADYWMFPCKEAREPYEKDNLLRKVFTKNENKMFYVPSSINDILIEEGSIQRFSDLGIPEDAFVISYFGRHNEIKGYDIIKELGKRLLDRYPKLYFICGGRGEIEPLSHDRWIELGFVNNTHELLYQSDLYISANRETYFDLVVLEILRSSTKVILSNTGGNKFFKSLPEEDTKGIEYYDVDNLDELVKLTEMSIINKQESAINYKRFGEANRDLFLKYFTLDKYMERYLKAINTLNNE